MEMLNSHFDRYDSKPSEISFQLTIEANRIGKYQIQVDPLRQAIRNGETEKADTEFATGKSLHRS